MKRRSLLLIPAAAAARLAGCAGTGKQENLEERFHINPADPYAELKKYRSVVNLLTAHLSISFQNLFSIGELYKEGPRGDEIMTRALTDLKRQHAELAKYLAKAPAVRATINPENEKLLTAYDAYIKALEGVAGVEYGEVSQEGIDALVKAGSEMEPIIP